MRHGNVLCWRPPVCRSGRAGQKRCRSDNVDNPWWRRQKGKKQPHDGALDILTSSLEEFSRAILFKALECSYASAEYVAVGGLHELVLKLLQLLLLLSPLPCAGRHVDRVDVFVVLDKRFDGFWCKLECNLMLRNHVDVYYVCLDVDKLVVEQRFDQRVGILA